MRNNGKTSAIDGRGYRSTFDMILSPRVFGFSRLARGFNGQEDFRNEVVAARG
jgi:hypothetical protein